MVVQQKDKEIPQFHPKYISQVLPFTIPRMVSGPDFYHQRPWRRHYDDGPKISAPQFRAAFARRVEAPCRTDWTALPILRSVTYKFVAEHTMTTGNYFKMKMRMSFDTGSEPCSSPTFSLDFYSPRKSEKLSVCFVWLSLVFFVHKSEFIICSVKTSNREIMKTKRMHIDKR